jgi:2-polyprenyl-3-methyl-5-hydroxy-6-metoxy-1,4-benzoquinol methylase
VAVEPVVNQARTCSERGIDTINLPIEKVDFRKSGLFNVIVNFEVLEHLFSPIEFIKSCRKLLKKDGLLIFTTPNGEGFDVRLLGKLSSAVDHEHLNYFNPRSIEILLAKCGLQVIQITTPGKLDAELVRKKVLSGDFKVSQDSFLRSVLIDNWEKYGKNFQSFISDFGLSSHMLVVARNAK